MRTRSEWFLGARGSSLELCHDGTGSLIHPQIVTSTPIPGTVGHHHHPHGIIGTYSSIDNLNDIVVVVDVNQDQANQYHQNHNHHHHDHRQYNHYHHEHDHPHASPPPPELLHPSSSHRLPCRNNALPSSAPRATNSIENIASSGDRRVRLHPYERRPASNDVHSRSSAVERRHKARGRVSGKPSENDTIEYCCEEDGMRPVQGIGDDDGGEDDDILALQDELDGDEHDFAITQSHHFDMRAENQRRRRRRALLRRGSHDEIVASGPFPPTDDCCRDSTSTAAAAATRACGSITAANATERPSSAPASSFNKTAKKSKLSSKNLPSSSTRPLPVVTRGYSSNPSPLDEGERGPTYPANTPGTSSAITTSSATTNVPVDSGVPVASSHSSSRPASATAPTGHHLANRHKRNATTTSNQLSSSLGANGNSTTLPSRQNNLSMIVFSVLDFLF